MLIMPSGLVSPPQVGAPWQGDDQGAVGSQDAAGLGGVARPEDA